MIAKAFQTKANTSEHFRTGRLGIDIGSSSIKMARMEWHGGRWTITNRLLLPVDKLPDDIERGLADGFLSQTLQVLKKRPLSNSHHSSCVLPMSVTDIRSVEVPNGNAKEVDQMATEALRDASPDFNQRVTTLWRHAVTPHELAMVSAVSISNLTGEGVVNSLSEVGLRCCSIESVPFAMTRAASMSPGGRTTQPVGLLDWGHDSVTFVVAYQGRPEFVRSFRNCGSRFILKTLAEGLSMSTEDTRHVLAACGLPGNSAGQQNNNHISRTIEQIITPEIQNVAAEIRKTLLYLRHHISRILPSRLILFGGMAAVPNIAGLFQDQCGVETKPWSLDADNSHHTDPTFALALATSAREISR